MNAKLVKNVYNNLLPDFIKEALGGLIRKKLIGNKMFLETFDELVKAEGWSKADLKKEQFKRLKATCINAYENIPFYEKEFDETGFNPYTFESFEEFSAKVPCIDKETVLANFDALQNPNITDDYPSTTGGSSGTRLQVNNAWSTLYKENAFWYHYMSLYGYDYKKSKVLLLAGEESEALYSKSPLYNQIRVSSRYLNPDNMAEAVSAVNKYRPEIVVAIPSSAYQFCKYLRVYGHKLDNSIKAVFFRSENINPQQRKYIEETLNCKCHAYYGSTERIAWGEEIDEKDGVPIYRFNSLYGYTEIGGNDGASLIGTGFINPKMPLIRYKTDDIIVKVGEDRYTVEGHRSASLVGRNGENISVASYAHLEECFGMVDKYQLEQHKKGELLVNIVPRNQLTEDELAHLKKLYERMSAGKLDVTLKVVDHVELTPRGKFKLLLHSIEE